MAGWHLLPFRLLLLATVATVTIATNCHELTGNVTVVDEVCTVADNKNYLGNRDEPVILDFSRATQEALDGLLGRKNSDAKSIFEAFYGAIRMDSNSQITKFDFFDIQRLDGDKLAPDTPFISICNNTQLTTISGIEKLRPVPPGRPTNVLIYNNPSLDDESLKAIKKFDGIDGITAYLQSNTKECRFANPVDPTKYIVPTDEDLKNCESIRGDFILEGGAPEKEIKLDDVKPACLRLINVDLSKFKIEVPPPAVKGLSVCANGKKSEIRGNPGLCEAKQLKELSQYYEDSSLVQIVPDNSCEKFTCNSGPEALDRFILCKVVSGNADLSTWFTDPTLAHKPSVLETAADVSIANSSATKIDFPILSQITSLTIDGNDHLVEIELPQVTSLEKLTITGNPKLHLNEIKKLAHISVTTFSVECNTYPEAVVTNLKDLSLCTVIYGPLILADLLEKDIPETALQHITSLDGCITIRNTALTNLKFLEHLSSTCEENHLLEDNPNLCPITMINGVPVKVDRKKKFKEMCGFNCTDTVVAKCGNAYGGIKITDSTELTDLEDLEFIEGSLTISDTELTFLNFPKLTRISGKKGPLLRIVNNRHLISIKMPELRKIEFSGQRNGRLLEITGNPNLENIKFLSQELRGKCTGAMDDTCLYDGHERAKPRSWIHLAIAAGILATIYILLLAGCLYLCCTQVIREGREMETTRRIIAEKVANPRKEYTCPGMPGGPYWQHLVKTGDAVGQKSEQPGQSKKSQAESDVKSDGKVEDKVEPKSTPKAPGSDPAPAAKPKAPASEPSPTDKPKAPPSDPAPAAKGKAPPSDPAPAAKRKAPPSDPAPAAKPKAPPSDPPPAAKASPPAKPDPKDAKK